MDKQILHGGAQRLAVRWVNLDGDPPTPVSRYQVAPGEVCSRHVHTGKIETWLIVAGRGVAEVGARRFEVAVGDAIVTFPGEPHRLANAGDTVLEFVNIVARTGDAPVSTRELE
ncbi:MAG: cupin domain-containing protein [Alphaproteobacteria bacterium]|nr:cupin domain-containing protein [Alphaproteobacteria bacterium]